MTITFEHVGGAGNLNFSMISKAAKAVLNGKI
jgi:hypothetical protein